MKCQYYSCIHNSLHEGDRPKGYCSVPEDVEINMYRECNTYKFCGEVINGEDE